MINLKVFSLLLIFSVLLLISGCRSATEQSTNQNTNQTSSVSTQSIIQLTQQFINTQKAHKPSKHIDYSAHWLNTRTFAIPKKFTGYTAHLVRDNAGTWQSTRLKPISAPAGLLENTPQLASFKTLQQSVLTPQKAKQWLKSPLFVVYSKANKIHHVSHVQTGEVIDHLYTHNAQDANEIANFGASITATNITFNLWAPTALEVKVHVFTADKQPRLLHTLLMQENTETGAWFAQGPKALQHHYYQYQLKVYHPATQKIETITTTDPYSLSLSNNSEYSQIVDLSLPITQPNGWHTQQDLRLKNVEDHIFYETHIRDFSATDTQLSNPSVRGKYLAFAEKNSAGIQHLTELKKAGLNTVHLLPTFDLGTINENSSLTINNTDTLAKLCNIAPKTQLCQQEYNPQQTIEETLNSFNSMSDEAQHLVSQLKEIDNYNWGYDPFHYTVPEGSYANNPEGIARIVEFRTMIQHLHNMGFRVIMDVVYNHTHKAGLAKTSVLDKIVPNYYHRLDPITGDIAQSTCCDNTATERKMMAKLMTDSLVTWARDYRIDGFRFDLMGHQPKTLMLTAREAVRAIDNDTYFYGEGWNFGEVANNQYFTQASQLELAGTEIGTFSDRLRDAVRGAGMGANGDDIRRNQGIGNGLLIYPNELNTQPENQQSSQHNHQQNNQQESYNLLMDQLRIGLAGNLAHYPLINAQNNTVLGKDVPYGDQPTGYALDPADTINYVSKHDNQTLWDNNQYRNNFKLSTDQRVRMHMQSLSFVLLAQGIPFVHMGSEFMRSKSFLRDSYNYGDWFNRVDFSQQRNFYDVGLPPAVKDEQNWPLIRKVLTQNEGRDKVTPAHINLSATLFKELLAIRTSSPLFSLPTANSIIEKVSFLNTGTNHQQGLIVMLINDNLGEKTENTPYQNIMVIFNTSLKQQEYAYNNADEFRLHPVQRNSVDNTIKTSTTSATGFSIPALSYAVFIK